MEKENVGKVNEKVELFHSVYEVLHNELEQLSEESLNTNKFFVADKKTGELIPVMEEIPLSELKKLNGIKRKLSKLKKFYMIYQESEFRLAQVLSGNSLKVLCMMRALMKFGNLVKDLTYEDISSHLKISSRSVIRAMIELEGLNIIKIMGRGKKRTYKVNPSMAWKGKFQNLKGEMGEFEEPAIKKIKK